VHTPAIDDATMQDWTVAEMHELARAIVAAGDTFYCRRTLEQSERGELGLRQLLTLLSYSDGTWFSEARLLDEMPP
jgi:hypothetical protein